jgi:hypothetical protein
MTNILPIALSFLVMLGACTGDRAAPARENRALNTAATNRSISARQETRCVGEANASVNGKPKRVRMEITPCKVVPGEAPEAILTNIGGGRLGYGPGFRLEKRTDRGWRWINRRQAFPLPLFYLHPGEQSDPEPIAVYFAKPQAVELEPGLYRVTKGVQLAPGQPRPPGMTVDATFRVGD